MTAFYKVVSDGYIEGFGTNGSDSVTGISEAEYSKLTAFFNARPTAPDGKTYLMRDDPLEWVLVDDPYADPDVDAEEAMSILLGGAE